VFDSDSSNEIEWDPAIKYVIITSYECVRSGKICKLGFEEFHTMIMDEAHKLKNSDTGYFK